MNIKNSISNTLVSGTKSNDSITNTGSNVTISSGAGNDTLWNEVNGAPAGGKQVSLNGGEDNDILANDGDNGTILGGKGNDSIHNWGANSKIDAGAGNDSIDNEGNNSTIYGGEGKDFIFNDRGDKSYVDGGNLDDTINNRATYATILGGEGDDSIYNGDYGNQLVLDGGEGNDKIKNTGSNNLVIGGAGNDTIDNSDNRDNNYVTINAGAGNDSINNDSDNILFQYKAGDGFDTINGFKANSTLSISAQSAPSSIKSGSDIILTVDNAKITLQGAANLSKVNIVSDLIAVSTINVDKDYYDNHKDNVLIIGNYLNNLIFNYNNNVTILGNGGDDDIVNYEGSFVTMDGGEGNDQISSYNDFNSIQAGSGNDEIDNSGENVTIDAGAGNDSISTGGSNVTIDGGAGNDYIQNYAGGKLTSINAGAGNDSVYNVGDENIIDTGSGNDTIENLGNNTMINAGAGDDSISNKGISATIDGGDGSDTIENDKWSDNVLINGGTGNDSIKNGSDNVTINGGAGNDTLTDDSASFSSISGAEGDDLINVINGSYVTVNGGAGKDSIKLDSNTDALIEYNDGDGNDIIEGFNIYSTLDIGGAHYASIRSGNDLIIRLAEGEITLKGALNLSNVNILGVLVKSLSTVNSANNVLISGSNYDDSISNSGSNVTILAQAGIDTISNRGKNVLINGGSGKDSLVNNTSGKKTTILGGGDNDYIFNNASNGSVLGGAGNDYILNGDHNSTLNGGDGDDTIDNAGMDFSYDVIISGSAGNDSISNTGSNVTISGGVGNDTLWNDNGSNILFQYAKGDGNDIIRGFKADSTLSISAQSAPSSIKSGSDIILTVDNSKITLQGAANLSKVNIIETPVNINNDEKNKTVTTTNVNDTITNTGEEVKINALRGNDSINNNSRYVSIDSGEGNDFISNKGNYANINSQSGNDTIHNNASNAQINGGTGNDSIFISGYYNFIDGGDGSDTIKNYNDSNSALIMGGAGNDSIDDSKGNDVTISGGDGNDSISSKGTYNFISGDDGSDLINIQSSYTNTISGGKGSDTINLDMNTNKSLIQYNSSDGNDVITGFNSTSTLKLGDGDNTYSKSISGDDIIITDEGGGKITLKGAATLSSVHIDGVTNVIANNTKNETVISGDRLEDSISNRGYNVKINTFAGKDTISNYSHKVTIDAGADSDTINNFNANNSSISAGSEGDVINSRNGYKNTINGGAGNDSIYVTSSDNALIEYNSGDGSDYVSGFNETSTLQISNGNGTYYRAFSGNDVIITVDKNKVTLEGAATLSTINIIGDEQVIGQYISNDENNVAVIGTTADDSIYNSGDSVTIDAGAGNDSIYNPNGSNVTIEGGKGSDSIYNSYDEKVTINGGEGNDSIYNNHGSNVTINGGTGDDTVFNVSHASITIDGGAGNDEIRNSGDNVTISGGAGNDSITNKGTNVLFTYTSGDGNDYISGFNASSTLSISDELYSSQTSGDNVILKVGESNITLAGAATLSTINIIGDEEKEGKYLGTFLSNDSLVGTEFNDTIQNIGDNVIILAQGGNDTIYNGGEKATIDAGKGNDTILNREDYGSSSSIIGGAGKDSIINERNNEHVTISGDAGNDFISNKGHYASINSGDGNDYIDIHSNSNKIEGGKGDDSIANWGRNVTINAGEGNDSIINRADNVTIDAGTGDDSINISNYGEALTKYTSGDGNDLIIGFDKYSTLSISGDSYTEEKSGNDIILTVGEGAITLTGAAKLSKLNIIGEKKETEQTSIESYDVNNTLITGTEGNDIINNSGMEVTINALGGNDSITNNGSGNNALIDAGTGDDTIINNHAQEVTIEAGSGDDSIYTSGNSNTLNGGAGNDTLTNAAAFFSSIAGAEGDDLINVTNSIDFTVNGGAGNDSIKLDSSNTALIEYNAGDGNDLIEGFNNNSTLEIIDDFSTTKSGSDIIVTVGEGKVTLKGAATLSTVNIGYDDDYDYGDDDDEEADDDEDNSVSFVVMNSKVTSATTGFVSYAVANAYQYNQNFSVLNVSNALENPVKVTNGEDSAIKANGAFGTAILSSGNVLEYAKNNVALTSENYGDKITFSQDTNLNYGEIQVKLLAGSVLSTNGAKEITFDNNSSANITAPEGAKINVKSGTFSINNLPVNSTSGAGTITVTADGLSFSGYGAQFVALQVAKENYLGNAAPITASYNSADESYTIQNTACVKTLANDFTKLTFDISADENANFKVNDKEFLVASDADNINVIEANGNTFKIQGKELDAEKIGRVTIDEQITFSGTEINFDGVQVNYALNKPVIYSLDGKTITINDAATLTTGDETKTFNCEAGSYVVNGRTFETTADLTFTADASEIKIPLSDANTEIYFDGVQVSGDSGEIVFDLANDKITIPTGANLNFTSHDDIKLNLAAGNFTIDGKRISFDSELEITANKESLQVPLSEKPVTVNDAKITGAGEMTIDNTDALFFSILLPDGALVQNTSNNTFELAGKNTSAYFGDPNKKVQLIDDGTAYIEFDNEKGIGVGFNTMMFEHVEIEGVDAWTVETSGTSGIDKITGITDGATVSTSTEDIDAGDLRFEVETSGAGEFNICGEKITTTGDATYVVYGNSDGEIKVAPKGEEYADDDSEAAGKVYNFDKAGDYTVNGITFHATENSKVQTITRGVELDLSTGTFQYDGLTLNGSGTAQINRYNTSLVSLTDGAIVSSDDKSKYSNRQFEIEGAVEIIGKKFESNEQIRCALINIEDSWDFEIDGEIISIPFSISGFVANDKYVQIKDECYDGVKVVDKKLSSIEGVKNSAGISGNGLSNFSILTTESGEFSIRGRKYKITDDSDGVTFVTSSHGNVIEINGLQGSVEGDFENEIRVNGKAIRLTGASSVKVTSDGENITEISNVAGDLITADGKSYRKNVRVYELGGAEKLTTSADGTIIFSGNKFKTSAGKIFNLDEAGNISGIETVQSDDVVSAENVTEDLATMNLSTTNELEEVFGDFSEGLTVNGVFVKVTDSTNFVVKDDDENVYIETTAADTFNINGKTFTTSADKTIFKLDKSGNVSEIVTDSFYPDKEAYLIRGDFNDEIIFNGQKFCVTGTNDTSIFLGDESLITINLAKNAVEVVENGGVDEIALNGEGDITIGGKTFSTSNDFAGTLQTNSANNFVGTISGTLGGFELYGITINSENNFSVTGDGEKITAIDNLQNGSFTCDSLDSITINGSKVSVENSDEITVEVTNGELKISGLSNGANVSSTDGKIKFVTDESGEFFVNGTILTAKANDTFIGTSDSAKIINARVEEILSTENASVISGKENVTLKGGDLVVVEDTSAKINITASKGNDTIVSAGENVSVTFKGGATEIFATGGKMKISGYNASTGSGFHTDYANIFAAVDEGNIVFNKGRITIGSAVVIDEGDNNLVNFFDTNGELQKVGGAFTDKALNLSKETADLVLYADKDSTLTGGAGSDSIFAFEGSKVDGGAGKNYIEIEEERGANADGATIAMRSGKTTVANFKAGFDSTSDRLYFGVNDTIDFKFDGNDLKVYNNNELRGVLSNVASGADFVNISTADDNSAPKIAVAKEGAVITVEDEIADLYIGEKSGVDFTNYAKNLFVNLGSENLSVGGGEVLFTGINQITVGGGQNTLISSSQNETLTGSDGSTEYIFSKDSGRDVIKNFNVDADKINVGNETITAVNVNSAGGVRMEISGSAVLTLENAQGKKFQINNFVALVDKNITYDAEANYFVATEQNASVIVNESAEIWLDGSHGKYFSGDIRTLDATTSNGKNALAGNNFDNIILAGKGDTSLWGGNLGDDLLQGGAGKNTFFYTNGNGNDTIQGANNGDVINLSQVTLEQIASTNITAAAVTINFKDGGSLQVNSAADVTYQLSDGSKFSANHAQATWLAK